jgi:hypothetical protein
VGANRLDLSRRPTCCTTWQRPTNIRLLRKFTVWPNTRPSVYERFVRHLQYAAGIGWLQANTPGCSSATLSHVSLLGLSAQQHRAPENFGSPKCVRPPTEHLRMLTEHLRTLTGIFGFHRNLRVPTKNLRVLELRSGVRRQSLTNTSPSGFIAHRRYSSEDFGPPPVRYNRHRASSDAHRNLRIPPDLLEIQKPPSKVTA